MAHTGQCLCGACKVVVNSTHQAQVLCHCTDCQQTSGSAFSTNIAPKEADVKMTGDVREYKSPAASGNIVTRYFCGTCGSPLAHRSVVHGELIALQTGNIPGFKDVPIAAEFFAKDRWSVIPAIPGANQGPPVPGK